MSLPPSMSAAEVRAAMQELWMPADSRFIRIASRGSVVKAEPETLILLATTEPMPNVLTPTWVIEEWDGYSFEMFGRRLDALPISPRRPLWHFEDIVIVEVWWATAFIPGERVRAEGFWRDEQGGRLMITAAGRRWDGKPLQKAGKAIRILQRFEAKRAGGRPHGTRKGHVWARQDYLDWYAEAGSAYAREDNPLTLKDLGDAMGVSEDTARGRLRDPAVNLPWPPESYPDIWDPDD